MVALELSENHLAFILTKKVDEVTFAPYHHLIVPSGDVTQVASTMQGITRLSNSVAKQQYIMETQSALPLCSHSYFNVSNFLDCSIFHPKDFILTNSRWCYCTFKLKRQIILNITTAAMS